MRNLNTILTLLSFLLIVGGCTSNKNDRDGMKDNPNIKKSEKVYSPNKRYYATIYETILDSTESNTQVVLNFVTTGAGIYSVKGINKNIEVYWVDNSTIVIKTNEEYEPQQKLDQVQSFDNFIKIKYIYFSTTQTLDSICTINEILNDKYEHLNELFKSLTKTDSSFNQIVTIFKHHITDTITKSKNFIILNFGKDFGIELHIKGLKSLKQIAFNDINVDKMQMVQYYHGPHIIKDDVIDNTINQH